MSGAAPPDALAGLRQALSPRRGMRRIPMPLESYAHPSAPLSSKRLVNLMAEQAPGDARTHAALLGIAGLVPLATAGAGPVCAMNGEQPGHLYVCSGSHFYDVIFSETGGAPAVTDMGDIGTPSLDSSGGDTLLVTIAVGPTAVVVCVPPNAWTAAHGGALHQIAGTFPGAGSVCYLDGYFVFTDFADTARFFLSYLLDPTMYSALDFAYSDGFPNVLRRAVTVLDDVWLFGPGGIEVWYDAGAPNFAFRRRQNGIVPGGTTNAKSIAVGNGSAWWLGVDGVVYRSKGYGSVEVSDHAIERAIAAEAVQDAYFTTDRGHGFYVLNLIGRTVVYDTKTKLWHHRSSSTDGAARWRGRSASAQPVLIGDNLSGALFAHDQNAATENGAAVIRQATFPPLHGEGRRLYVYRVEIEMEVGGALNPRSVLLEWSIDGGWTFPFSRTLQAGAAGQRRYRVFATLLGSGYSFTFRITMQGLVAVYGVDANVSDPELTG